MAQEYFKLNGVLVEQPTNATPQWETTYTEDTDRTMGGTLYGQALFTVESYAMAFNNLTPAQASTILKIIIPTPSKLTYTAHYFSWYDGEWKDATFYTGKGSLEVTTLKESLEKLKTISFNMIKAEKIV